MTRQPLRWRLLRLLLLLGLVVTFGPWVLAPAPRGSIQYAGLVLKKLDPTSPPSYPNEFFRDREQLSIDVEAVLRVMADPVNADPNTWCNGTSTTPRGINQILELATLTNTYFDIGQTTNPALDDFKKDWLRLKQLAGCS